MIWLTTQQLMDIGVSKGIMHRNRAKWTSRKSARRGRNGKNVDEVLLDSLPAKFQAEYLKKGRVASDEGREIEEDRSLTIETEDGSGSLALQSERKLVEALTRYGPATRLAMQTEAVRLADIIERYDGIRPKRQKVEGGSQKLAGTYEYVPEVLALCEEARCSDPVVLAVEKKRRLVRSPHTLEAWSKAYRRDGLAAFLRKPHDATAHNDSRKAVVSDAAIEWMNANWRTKPSPWALFKALEKQATKKRWKIPAYGWVYRKYKSLPKIVSALTFEGEKKFAAKWGVYLPRTVEDLGALQILCGDHSVRDVTVMLPDGTLTRPWLTIWLDLRTWLIWGWHLDLTPSSNTIGLAYVNGVKNFGAQPLSRPEDDFFSYLYTDQGKDYKSKMLLGHTLEFKTQIYPKAARIEGGLEVLCTQRKVGFMEELGLKHIMARGYNAKEKPVERVHADISRFEQNSFTDEYCGRGTEHKPDAWVKAWHKHQRLLKKFDGNMGWLQAESPFMSLDDYRENLGGWINENNHESHTRSVLSGSRIVPIDEFNRLYTTRYEISDGALELLLMRTPDAPKKIGKDGITLNNGLYWHENMSRYKGESVEVRYSDGNYDHVYVVLPDKTVVEATNLRRSSIINPNKKTMETVARAKANEKKINREWHFIQQSNWRGENTEDRVAQLINPDETPSPERQKIAVNAQPMVYALSRFDRAKSVGSSKISVTAEQVDKANVIEGMFGRPETEKVEIKEEWEL